MIYLGLFFPRIFASIQFIFLLLLFNWASLFYLILLIYIIKIITQTITKLIIIYITENYKIVKKNSEKSNQKYCCSFELLFAKLLRKGCANWLLSTALRCRSFSKKTSKKSTYAVMVRIIITFANQIFL